jgi:hypothetical protein
MPNGVASREFAADGRGPTHSLTSGRMHLAGAMLATALSAVTIGGCTPTFTADSARNSAKPVRQIETVSKAAILLPGPAMLRRQPEPDCAFRGPVSYPITAEETRQKLDYERQCYRQAETLVRARLEQLQDSVQEMIKVARRQ